MLYFKGNLTMSMFNSYNEKSCLMECRIEYAYNKSGCLPWDYPIPAKLRVIQVLFSLQYAKVIYSRVMKCLSAHRKALATVPIRP